LTEPLDLLKPQYLQESFETFVDVIEGNRTYINLNPKCEPQLGKRGLHRNVGAPSGFRVVEMALLWMLNLSDGQHDLLTIAKRSGEYFGDIRDAAQALLSCDLLREVTANPVG
jgi:aminopeptidase-like protein